MDTTNSQIDNENDERYELFHDQTDAVEPNPRRNGNIRVNQATEGKNPRAMELIHLLALRRALTLNNRHRRPEIYIHQNKYYHHRRHLLDDRAETFIGKNDEDPIIGNLALTKDRIGEPFIPSYLPIEQRRDNSSDRPTMTRNNSSRLQPHNTNRTRPSQANTQSTTTSRDNTIRNFRISHTRYFPPGQMAVILYINQIFAKERHLFLEEAQYLQTHFEYATKILGYLDFCIYVVMVSAVFILEAYIPPDIIIPIFEGYGGLPFDLFLIFISAFVLGCLKFYLSKILNIFMTNYHFLPKIKNDFPSSNQYIYEFVKLIKHGESEHWADYFRYSIDNNKMFIMDTNSISPLLLERFMKYYVDGDFNMNKTTN